MHRVHGVHVARMSRSILLNLPFASAIRSNVGLHFWRASPKLFFISSGLSANLHYLPGFYIEAADFNFRPEYSAAESIRGGMISGLMLMTVRVSSASRVRDVSGGCNPIKNPRK